MLTMVLINFVFVNGQGALRTKVVLKCTPNDRKERKRGHTQV